MRTVQTTCPASDDCIHENRMTLDKLTVKELEVTETITVRSKCGKNSITLHVNEYGAGIWVESSDGMAMLLSGFNGNPAIALTDKEYDKKSPFPLAISLDKHGAYLQYKSSKTHSTDMLPLEEVLEKLN